MPETQPRYMRFYCKCICHNPRVIYYSLCRHCDDEFAVFELLVNMGPYVAMKGQHNV